MKKRAVAYKYKTCALTIVAVLAICPQAEADWIQTVGISQKSSNLGGAVTATAHDYDVFYTNPAGMADFKAPVIGLGAKVLQTENLKFEDSGGNHDAVGTLEDADFATVPSFGAYLPITDTLTAGIGMAAPFAIAGDWNRNSGSHRFNMVDQSLIVTEVVPSLGYQVNDRLNIGAGLNVAAFKHFRITSLFGDDYLAVDAGTESDGYIRLNTDNDFSLPVAPYNEFSPSFNEIGYTIGAQFKANDRLDLGFVYKSEVQTTFEGEVETNIAGYLTDRYAVDIDMPRHLQVGASYGVIQDKLRLSSDLQWTNWSDAKGLGSQTDIKFKDRTILNLTGLQVDYDANDTVSLRLGAEYTPKENWSFQAGYVYDPSIFDDEHIDILTYSSDRHIYSLGATYRKVSPETGKGWVFDIGGQIINYEDRTIEAGESQNLGGVSSLASNGSGGVTFVPNTDRFTYGGYIYSVGLSASYNF